MVELDDSAPGRYGPSDPGGGPWIESLGIREWYNDPSNAPAAKQQTADGLPTWHELLTAWDILELDFQAVHINLVDVLDTMTWGWFKKRVLWRLSDPQSLTHRLIKVTQDDVSGSEQSSQW